ncbi:MAG: hypothetical protein IPJ37_03875 [Bacteroidales bacterium]|nr:hypothetical protein [Bacteroidales bacterium]
MLVSYKDKYIFFLQCPPNFQTYMAAGKPILSMMDGKLPGIINDKAGLTCNAGDYNGLAKCALKISKMTKDEIKSMSGNSVNYYKNNFDKEKIMTRLEEILKKLQKIDNGCSHNGFMVSWNEFYKNVF